MSDAGTRPEAGGASSPEAWVALIPERFRRPSALRFMVGHMAAYPVAFVFAVGMIPLALASLAGDTLGSPLAATLQIMLRAGAPALLAFVIVHLLAIPWMRTAGEGERQRRFFFIVSAGLLVAGSVLTVFSWLRLITGHLR